MTEATNYRAEALRLRSEAENVADANIKRRLLDIAYQYEQLAKLIEKRHEQNLNR
jgi:hypothetical protein